MEAARDRITSLKGSLHAESATRIAGRRYPRGHRHVNHAAEQQAMDMGFSQDDLARGEGVVAGIPANVVDIMTPEVMRRRVIAEQQRYAAQRPARSQGYHHGGMKGARSRGQLQQPRGSIRHGHE